MGTDLNTTIAGVVGFLAIISNWLMGLFGITFQIPVEVQGAIAGVAFVVVAWYTGKANEPPPPPAP